MAEREQARRGPKAAIDTLFVRFGYVLAAATAFVGSRLLHVPSRWLLGFNAGLAFFWLALGVIVAREHERLSTEGRASEAV